MKIGGNLGIAWLSMTIAFAIHIFDEAKNDFLPLYNAMARISGTFPVFTFSEWLTSLIVIVVILFAMTIFAFRNKKWMCYLSYFYALVLIIHGGGHLALSIYFKEPSVGLYSSFLLLITALYLISKAWRTLRFSKQE